jgi:hypothetical protein
MSPSRLLTSDSIIGSRTVADAMHHGIVTCSPRAGLDDVAELLAGNGVHCAVVAEPVYDDEPPALWGSSPTSTCNTPCA